MKAAPARTPAIRIAVLESDPLRCVGLRSLLAAEVDMELFSATGEEVVAQSDAGAVLSLDIALLGAHDSASLLGTLARLHVVRPELRVLVTNGSLNDDQIVQLIVAGARGYLDQSATPAEYQQAIRSVHGGMVWASRRILSKFVERASARVIEPASAGESFTEREAQVLKMLIVGHSNKEIGGELGIEERTVKAHVAKLMRKVGVENRVALSVFAVTHSLVTVH